MHSKKAQDAFSKLKKPVIIEDDGLFINSLDGFPGPYSSYVFKTIGNKGILNLLKNNRKAKFVSIITYCDKKNYNPLMQNLMELYQNFKKVKVGDMIQFLFQKI